MPSKVVTLARQLGLRRPPGLVRSSRALQLQLLSKNWRMLPVQFDLPSNSQIFGRLVSGAGVHGILYPSVRNPAGRCLALFPQNWASSDSFVEIMDPAPSGSRLLRLDGRTGAAE